MAAIINTIKNASLSYADIGDIITYQIVISNTGDLTASNCFFVDTLPSDIYFTNNSIFINGSQMLNYKPTIPITIPNINPNETVTLSMQCAVNAVFPFGNNFINTGNFLFSYTATSTNFRVSQLTNSVQTNLNKAFLLISKKFNSSNGLFLNIPTEIVIENVGNTIADGIILKEILDEGMSIGTSLILEDGISISGDVLSGISLNSLPPSSRKTVTYSTMVTSLPNSNFVDTFNNLYYSYKVDPLSIAKSTASTGSLYSTTTIVSSFLKSNYFTDKSSVILGDTIVYTVSLNNIGNSNALSVTFIDTLPTAITFLENSVFINSIPSSSNPTTGIFLSNLSPNALATITFIGTVTSIPSSTLESYGYTSYFSSIPNSALLNTLPFLTNTISLTALSSNIIFNKSSNGTFSTINEVITYTLSVSNFSAFDIFNCTLFDTIPSGLSFISNSVFIDCIPSSSNPNLGILLNTISKNSITTITFNALVL